MFTYSYKKYSGSHDIFVKMFKNTGGGWQRFFKRWWGKI